MVGEKFRLTQYSHGAGCGCKIAPKVLEEILSGQVNQIPDSRLLVGNESRDDAAVYDTGQGDLIISTTDFFTPIVDEASDFGRIAAANAISDVYAMGGRPLFALAILGWPVEKLPTSLAREVIEGGRETCTRAGITLAGGHSIDTPEPIFGLAVTGMVSRKNLKKNNTAKEGDLIYLTRPLGTGILSTAHKRGVLVPEHLPPFLSQLSSLNKIGEEFGKISGVTAMTDVTGFGLAGHLLEMADGAGLGAELYYSHLALLEGAAEYAAKRVVPDATFRNWNSYGSKIDFEKGVNVMEAFQILPDPQTNGGLLVAVDPGSRKEVEKLLQQQEYGNHALPIGKFTAKNEKTIRVVQAG